jgi:hypothetical protein
LKQEQAEGERSENRNRNQQFAPAASRDAVRRCHLIRPLDPFRRQLKRPRDDQRDRKTQQHQHDDHCRDRAGKMERRHDRGRDLHDEPANDGIRHGDAVNIAPL